MNFMPWKNVKVQVEVLLTLFYFINILFKRKGV